MNVSGVVLALLALVVVVAVMAYRAGYLRGQAELLRQRQPTEAERSALPMTSLLPPWRLVGGWAAYVFSVLLYGLFLFLAFRYAKAWGWTVLIVAWILWFALFMGAVWLGEWCWRLYRAAQERLRHEEEETLRALDARRQ
jgi:hypothetical protein